MYAMKYDVFVLQVITKYDLEDCGPTIGRVKNLLQRWCHPGMHARRNIAFVMVTDESLKALGERLYPGLAELKESGGVERFMLTPDPGAVFSDYGEIDPLMHWLRLGRVEAGKRSDAQDVRHRQRWQRRV